MPATARITPMWQRWRERFHRRPRLGLATLPALAATLWLIPGILATGLPAIHGTPPGLAAAATLAAGLALALTLDRRSRRFAWLLPAGALWTLFLLHAPWQTLPRIAPQANLGVTVEGVTLHPGRATAASPAPPAPPSGLEFALERLQDPTTGQWRSASGRVWLRLPPDQPLPPYATTLRVAGALLIPEPGLFPGDFDWRAQLRARGITHALQATTVEEAGPPHGWRRAFIPLLQTRDAILARVTRHLSPETAAFPAAILFGGDGRLDPDARATYVNSGTIHIFSVSGLHVAILASLLLPALRLLALPFRWRHALLPPLLLLYVLTTGAEPAACRAWVMISVWAGARAWLQPSLPLNTLAVAALLLLAWNPLNLFRTGFQFSFILVFFLILGWPLIRRVRQACFADDAWRPARLQPAPALRRAAANLLELLLGNLLACTAATGLTAWINQRLIPGAILTNLGIGIFAWATMTIGALKAALSFPLADWWPLPDRLLASLLACCANATQFLAELGSEPPFSLPVPRPALPLVLLFHLALATTLAWNGRRRLAAAATLLLLPFLMLAGTGASHPHRTAIFFGDGAATPGIVWFPEPTRPPAVLLPDSPTLARALLRWLTVHGQAPPDLVVATAPLAPATASGLAAGEPPPTLVHPPATARNPKRQEQLRELASRGTRLRTLNPGAAGEADTGAWQLLRSSQLPRTTLQLTTELPAGPATLNLETDAATGHARLRLASPGEPPVRLTFARSRQPRIALLPPPGRTPPAPAPSALLHWEPATLFTPRPAPLAEAPP
ncbi:MAG: ComEC/Rec2 family competence protein [Lentisphaeria bacterium]|jgi:ComEC/Rec2-related protein